MIKLIAFIANFLDYLYWVTRLFWTNDEDRGLLVFQFVFGALCKVEPIVTVHDFSNYYFTNLSFYDTRTLNLGGTGRSQPQLFGDLPKQQIRNMKDIIWLLSICTCAITMVYRKIAQLITHLTLNQLFAHWCFLCVFLTSL